MSRKRILKRSSVFLACLLSLPAGKELLLPSVAHAQQSFSTVIGQVTDPAGAVIVGATITITNSSTNVSRSTVSDSAGQYSIPALVPGNYSVVSDAKGFSGKKVDSLVLESGQTARVDFSLVVGNQTETVDVSGQVSGAQLQTENASVGEVIGSKKIVDLPLNGRNFVQLAQLIPGVNPGTSGSITTRRARGAAGTSDPSFGSTSIQVNGQRDTQNRYSVDGIEMMDYDAYSYPFSPSIDAISEFRVDTSTSGPDNSGAAGATVNIITKSGTNQIHGALFEFNRNNFFSQYYDPINQKSISAPRLNRNQFGANIGGPVWLPHLYDGHNKTFFFFNWESGRNLAGNTATGAIVPTSDERTGNLQGLQNKSGAISIYDPQTGQPFANNTIPTSRLSAGAQTLLKYTPAATVTNAALGANNFITTPPKTLSEQNNYTVRIDHTLSSRDSINAHYLYNMTYVPGVAFFGNDQDNNRATGSHYQITETHIFTPAIVNEFRYGRFAFTEVETFGTTGKSQFNIANAMNIPFASTSATDYGPPAVTISGTDGVFRTFGLQRTIGPRNRGNGINQFVDTLSLQLGKHFFKMGADIGRRTDSFTQARDPRGTFTFNGQYTANYVNGVRQTNTGSALADFLLGYVQSDSINPTHTRTNISSLIQGYYFADNWSALPNLTINLGLRYDHFPPWIQDNDRIADISIASNGINPGSLLTPSNSKNGRGLLAPSYLDFSPRLGFAWQPFGPTSTVLRGGYGVYWTPELANAYFTMVEGAQAQAGAQLTGNIAGQQPNLTLDNPFPGVSSTASSTYPFATAVDQNLKDQYTQQFNLTVEQPIGFKTIASLAYVGAKGTHNFNYYNDINIPYPTDPATPGLTSIASRRPNQTFKRAVQGDFSHGSSTYHALQAKLERRVANGLTYLSSYTFSKTISGPADIGGIVGGGFYGAIGLNIYNPKTDRSLSLLDMPHRFSSTVLYDVPFFRNTHGIKRALLDGFQLSTIVTAQSGIAAGVTNSVDTTATGQNSRPDMVAGQTVSLGGTGKRSYKQWFNTAAFTTAKPGEFGTSPRTGAVRMPGLVNTDFSAVKGFKMGESRNLQIRADIFNLFQHYNPDPAGVSLALNATNFGQVGTNGDTARRIIQLSGKFYF